MLDGTADKRYIRTPQNKDVGFTDAGIRGCIRPRSSRVAWCDIVWFSHQVPRYASLLWLVMHRKLKTLDMLRSWDVVSSNIEAKVCTLCEEEMDSRNHLFFSYKFSSRIWEHIKGLMAITNMPLNLNDIVAFLVHVAKSRAIRVIICKLVFAATCYFIWQERNTRLFKKTKRSHEQIIMLITSNIRLKLMTCSFKRSHNVQTLLHLWKVPESCFC